MIAVKTRCKILINSHAGKNAREAGEDELRRAIRDLEIDAEIVATGSVEQMEETVERLVREGVDRIGIAGGDGTIARAVQRLAYTETALGIIPMGTANNFAAALHLPTGMESALRILAEGRVREVDLGKVINRYFTEAAGVGLYADALAIYGAGTNKSFVRGVYAMLRVFFSFKAHRLQLTLDGKRHTERAVMCTAANSYRMGACVSLAPDATITDGALNVVIIGDLTRSELVSYYRSLRAQTHTALPKTSSVSAREVRIESRHRMNVHCDDRIVGVTPVTITSEPRALKVLVEPL